jgi:hypothetical protein
MLEQIRALGICQTVLMFGIFSHSFVTAVRNNKTQ